MDESHSDSKWWSNLFTHLSHHACNTFFWALPSALPTHTLPLSQEETNIVLVEKYRHPGRALFIVYFTVKTRAIVPNKWLHIVDWRHGVDISSNACPSTAMCNILNIYLVRKHNLHSKITVLVSWHCREWNVICIPEAITAERDFPLSNNITRFKAAYVFCSSPGSWCLLWPWLWFLWMLSWLPHIKSK